MQVDLSVFADREAMKTFVLRCEDHFRRELSAAVETIVTDREADMILLSGPSCSGKTTATARISGGCTDAGVSVKPVSADDFYRDRQELIAESPDGVPDLETFSALDGELLDGCFARLFSGRPAMLPHFDFVTQRRSGYEVYTKPAGTKLLMEGIQTIYPEFRYLLNSKAISFHGIYVCPRREVCFGELCFSPEELRFMRRVVRDNRTRGAEPGYTCDLWESVVANERRNMQPFSEKFDLQIDSVLGYEPFVIRPFFLAVMEKMPPDHPAWERWGDLVDKVKKLPEIPAEFVPGDSVFREFIGN